MKRAMIGVVAVVVAAVVGFTVYEVVSTSNTTTAISSSVSNSSSDLNNTTVSSGTSETDSSTISSTKASTTNSSSKEQASSKNTTSSSSTKSSATEKLSASDNKTENDSTKSSTTESSSTKSSTTENSGSDNTSSSNKTTVNNSSSTDSNPYIIDGEPVLFNNNSQVSAYYGTWTVGDKIGSATVGDGTNTTDPTGETLILTKSLYSFDGTVIEDPNYYIIAANASVYFGSEGWTGDVGVSDGIIEFIIAVPSNVKVTASTIYKYESQLKIIENDGSLAIMNGSETVYSASL